MYGYIYRIIIDHPGCTLNGCYYIGQHKPNGKSYYGSGLILRNYRKKYGKDHLKLEVLCECQSAEELNQKEAELLGDLWNIDAYAKGGKCLNLKAGGNQTGMSEEVRKKIALASKQRWSDPKYRTLIAKSNSLAQKGKPKYGARGKHLSLSTRMKIAQKAIGRHRKNFTPWNKGIKYTDEQKKNLIIANRKNANKHSQLGFKHSEETKKKIGEMQKGWKWYTDGKVEIHTAKCPNGFRLGRLTRPVIGKKAFNNGLITKYDYICPPGFKPGRLPNTVKRKKRT